MQIKLATRTKSPGTADLLPYAILYGSGGVLTKRGALIAGYFFQPPDSASSTDEQSAHISSRVNTALTRLGSGWSSWTDAISIPAPAYPAPSASHFRDPISRMIDQERRLAFEAEGAHFDNERVFTICWTPPNKSVSRLEQMLYTGGGGTSETDFARYTEAFEQVLQQFEDECGKVLNLRRMQGFKSIDPTGRESLQDELVNYLNYAVTGQANGVNIPPWGAYLDNLIGGQELELGDTPIIGDDFVAVVSIDGFPAATTPNVISALNTLAMPYRFTQRMIYLDGVHAEKDIDSYHKKWSSKVKPMMAKLMNIHTAPINAHAAEMVRDAEDAMSLSQSGIVKFGYYSPTVILRDPDYETLRNMARAVRSTIQSCGYGARIERMNTVEAWRGSLPGDTKSNVRRPTFHTGNLADLLPLSGVWTGAQAAPCPFYEPGAPPLMFGKTIGAIPFRMNFHVSDVGHTLCFGPTGTGKSSLMNATAFQALRYKDMRITCFDHKRGMLATAMAVGGNHYEIGETEEPLLCPLRVLNTEADRIWAEEWVSVCFKLQSDRDPTPVQRQEIHLAIERLRDNPEHRSLSDFQLAVADHDVRDAIRYYTLSGSVGILDSRDDRIQDSYFNVFETLTLMNMGTKAALPILLYMFRRFERSLKGEPALLYISEAWQALGHPVWRDKLREWLKMMRSKNCAVIMDTQSLSDAVRSGLLDVLVESCPTKLFLPNVEAFKKGTDAQPGPYDFYRIMGLNDNQIDIIKNSREKRDLYWTSPLGCRLVDAGLGPALIAFSGATGEGDVNEVKKMIAEHGAEWPYRWLEKKGVRYKHLLEAAA